MKVGDVYIMHKPGYTNVARATGPHTAALIEIKDTGRVTLQYAIVDDLDDCEAWTRADMTAWAEAVGKLADYLMAPAGEVEE